jgi:hypothetical protein
MFCLCFLYIAALRSKREEEYRLCAIKDGRELYANDKDLHDFEQDIEKAFKKES